MFTGVCALSKQQYLSKRCATSPARYASPKQSNMTPRSPIKSPVRRVLGEITPNARRSPVVVRDELKTPAATSPLKKSRPVTPADVLSAKHRLEEEERTRQLESRKRSIEDDVDAIDFSKRQRTESWAVGEHSSMWSQEPVSDEVGPSSQPSIRVTEL